MRTLLYNRAASVCNGSTLVISFLLRQKLFCSSALFHGFRDSSKLREDFVITAVLQYSKEIETKNLPMTYTNMRNNSILHNNPITLYLLNLFTIFICNFYIPYVFSYNFKHSTSLEIFNRTWFHLCVYFLQ